MTNRSKARDDAEAVDGQQDPPVVGFDADVDPVQEAADRVAEGEARETARHRLQLQYGEYGQWIARFDLHDDSGALQFAAGHPIPAEMVDEQGRVVTARHRCHHTPDVRCELFNTPEGWSEPGAAVRPPNFQE